jgi:hypothetical protein
MLGMGAPQARDKVAADWGPDVDHRALKISSDCRRCGLVQVVGVAAHRDGRHAKQCNRQSDDQECPLHGKVLPLMGHRRSDQVQRKMGSLRGLPMPLFAEPERS